jgi:hypothetical protein
LRLLTRSTDERWCHDDVANRGALPAKLKLAPPRLGL